MNYQLILQLTLLISCCMLGCADDFNGASPEMRLTAEFQDNVQRVIAWAEKAGLHISGTEEVIIGRTDVPISDEWVAEGKSIPGVEEILIRLLESNDKRLHPYLTIQALGYVGTEKCVPVLAELTRNEAWRTDAVCALEKIARPECAQPLAASLFLDGDLTTSRFYAAQGLAKIATPEAIEGLETALSQIKKEEQKLETALAKARNLQSEDEHLEKDEASAKQ